MRKVAFISRRAAAQLQPASGAVLISIHDRSEPRLDPQPGWADVLYLRFHDTDGQSLGLEVFSHEQARQCLDFLRAHEDCDELVVHCQLGQSRSAGVALFFSEMFELPCFKATLPVSAASYKLYNRKVYGMLYEAAYGERGAAFGEMAASEYEASES